MAEELVNEHKRLGAAERGGSDIAVILGNLDLGPVTSMCTPTRELKDEEGNYRRTTYKATDSQVWQWECYVACVRYFGRPKYLFVPGGLASNKNPLDPRENTDLSTYDVADLAIEAIKLWGADEVYVAYTPKGVEVGKTGKLLDRYVADEVGAKDQGWTLHPELSGTRCSLSYQAPKAGPSWYRPTPLAMQIVISKLQEQEKFAQLIVRSSPQYFCYLGDGFSLGLVAPGFTGQTAKEATDSPENKKKMGIVVAELPSLSLDYLLWDAPPIKPDNVSPAPAPSASEVMAAFPANYGRFRRSSETEELVLFNDPHSGSQFSACPDNWRLLNGSTLHPSDLQLELDGRLRECAREFHRPKYLIANGDLVDGAGEKDGAMHVAFPNWLDQVRLASYYIRLFDPEEIRIAYGSDYHVKRLGFYYEYLVAKEVKAKDFGRVLRPKLNGIQCAIAHEIGCSRSGFQYQTTAPAVQMILARINREAKSANLMLWAHRHHSCVLGYSSTLGIVGASFSAQTDYMAKNTPEVVPQIGVFKVDLPTLDFDKRLWPAPDVPTDAQFEHAMLATEEQKS